ncbi:MAG: Chemoreceptor glutamine deamidase CheD [Methanomassiliicoccales archaeon PtaU1.Bin124]|nr:MAG: Chemoreceptor glutamine deamidase CheD [Methanomassiliicoccales archaeon PtaU1.Bin124]
MDSIRPLERATIDAGPAEEMTTRRVDSDLEGRVGEIKRDATCGVGEYHLVSAPGKLTCIGLGSCVGIAIYDLRLGIGGMAHAMLPKYDEGRDKKNASKYADSSIFIMVDELIELGCSKVSLRAKMAGGAQMFSFITSDSLNIGQRNADVARETLKKERIPLVGEHCGGSKGRTTVFDPSTAQYRVQIGPESFEI